MQFLIFLAYCCQSALVALGRACRADIAAMQDEPMMCLGDDVVWQVLHQFHLHAVGGGATLGYKPYAVAYAEYMRVDSHGAFVPNN